MGSWHWGILGFAFFFFFTGWISSIIPHSNGQHFEEAAGSKHKEHHANKNDATDNNASSSTIRGILINAMQFILVIYK
jgi:hypothetical protein